jgi:hypothetical protein
VAQALHRGAVDDVAHATVAVAAQDDDLRLVPLNQGSQLTGGIAESEVVARVDPHLTQFLGVELQPLLVAPRLAVSQLAAHHPGAARFHDVEQQQLRSPTAGPGQGYGVGEHGLVGTGEVHRRSDEAG